MTGLPPIQFHYALRLQRAKCLLVTTERGITDICFDVGYNSVGTFTTRFGECVGLSPNAFRRLARRFASVRLLDIEASLEDIARRSCGTKCITGMIEQPLEFEGLVFAALFQRAIPQGLPAACTMRRGAGSFVLPLPHDGRWYIMSVAIPPSATGAELFALDGLPRGRSRQIVVEHGCWAGDGTITLTMPSPLDPPMLATIPVFISRMCALGEFAASTTRGPHLAAAICSRELQNS